ncbi:PREDICTED: probable disease resistance protein At5g63020 [Fragaria vesca subsp. vesca]|uniref:probable disease resistance protein At5g63020 n=1 Tax=Fragaria vesca subsp. vesca TaxID=101020 RepID=UPI0002C308E5|nr:PREDICTED: probable disease resistance protein At5g63020 [Fragaria vesca subsp. vesca]
MDILITVAGKIAEYAVVPIIRQGGYIIHCKSNLHMLQTRLDELKATRGRMQNDIVAVERRGETIQPDVVLWMTERDKIIGKVEELLEDDQAKMECLHGFCPNLRTRHQLSRKSTKLLEVVVEMNGRVFPSIACGGRAEEVFLVSAKDYGEFDSRISTVNGIIDELKNLDTNKIGVYGIGGVGKTTLAEEVVRQVIKDGLFEDVVMVRDVKENPDIGRLQIEIAEKLGMSALESQSVAEKARQICGRIKNKKTLVVLDDIWSFFDLKVVGLPDVATCKILMTSRSREVSNKMGVQKEFQLAILGEKESWSI